MAKRSRSSFAVGRVMNALNAVKMHAVPVKINRVSKLGKNYGKKRLPSGMRWMLR